MSEPPAVPFPGVEPGAPVVDGDTVRELVARQEADIERLVAQLVRVERDADEVEAEVRRHPAYPLLDEAERGRFESRSAEAETFGHESPGTGRPRTTVDRRPRRALAVDGTPPRSAEDGTERGGGPGRLRGLVTSHWVWKLGLVLTGVALVLLLVH